MNTARSILIGGDSTGRNRPSSISLHSPFDTRKEAVRIECDFSDASVAACGAKILYRSEKTPSRRLEVSHLGKITELLLKNKEILFEISRGEAGRTRDDFETELAQSMRYLDSLKKHGSLFGAYEPRGVCVVILSSSWPLFHGLQFTCANLVVGNPVILKPAERTTCLVLEWVKVMQAEIDAFRTVQVVVGDRETGRRLAAQEGVETVVFQGTYEAGMRIRQDSLSNPSKEVLLFLGSKNPLVLDCEMTSGMERSILKDMLLGSGQNCWNAKLLFVQERHWKNAIRCFEETAKAFVGASALDDSLIGPLLDAAGVDRYLKFVSVLEREGARFLARGNRVPLAQTSCYVSPTFAVFEKMDPAEVQRSVSLQADVLGPHLTMIPYRDPDELSELIEVLSYGLMGSYRGGASPDVVRSWIGPSCGRILWNKDLVQFDPWSSPPARKRSGNHATPGLKFLEQISIRPSLE